MGNVCECGSDYLVQSGLCRGCERAYLVDAVRAGYVGTHDDDLECRGCGAHIADPHDPDCPFAKDGE